MSDDIFTLRAIACKIVAGSCMRWSDAEQLHTIASHLEASGMPEQGRSQDEQALRRLLAFRVAGLALYTDDGEMQDNSISPYIDFRRDSVQDIAGKLTERARAAAESKKPLTLTPSWMKFPPGPVQGSGERRYQVQQDFASLWCDVSKAEYDACSAEKRIVYLVASTLPKAPAAKGGLVCDLLDDEGENRAVRAFLLYYGGGNAACPISSMRTHLARSGFGGCWPEWARAPNSSTLTKAGAQLWLRYLFALETAK